MKYAILCMPVRLASIIGTKAAQRMLVSYNVSELFLRQLSLIGQKPVQIS
jgi:hypothetical protein